MQKKVYNKEKTKVIENPNLELGYLVDDKIIVGQTEPIEEIQEQFHYEVVKEYENGGADMEKVIDVPYCQGKPSEEISEEIQVYIEYTIEELERKNKEREKCNKQMRLYELKNWFKTYDQEFIKLQREMRLYGRSEIDIVSLDQQAETSRTEIKRLRAELKGTEEKGEQNEKQISNT